MLLGGDLPWLLSFIGKRSMNCFVSFSPYCLCTRAMMYEFFFHGSSAHYDHGGSGCITDTHLASRSLQPDGAPEFHLPSCNMQQILVGLSPLHQRRRFASNWRLLPAQANATS
eukprot:2312147-Pleurochrysis_carterae.AAC.1